MLEGVLDLKSECASALETFGLTLDHSEAEPVVVLKQDQNSIVMRARCVEDGAGKYFVAKLRSAEDKLVPFAVTAKLEKLLRIEHAALTWSDQKEAQNIVPRRRRNHDGEAFWLNHSAAKQGLRYSCWSCSEYIENGPSFHWLEETPSWNEKHASSAGELLAKLHCAGLLAKEKLTGSEAHQLASILPSLPKQMSSAMQAVVDGRVVNAPPLTAAQSSQIVALVDQAVDGLTRGPNASLLGQGQVIVHGDFHPGNVLFKDDRALAAIDLDYAHLEHPLFDLAYSLLMFAPSYTMRKCASAMLDGYLSHFERAALEPPAFLSGTDLAALAAEEMQDDSPAQMYLDVSASLILIWSVAPNFASQPGAREAAERMIGRLARTAK